MSKVVRFDHRRRQSERFAAAVDSGAEAGSPDMADELAVVKLLRDAGAATWLDDDARRRILAKITDADVDEPTVVAPAVPSRRDRSDSPRPRRLPFTAAAAALAVLAGTLGVQASQNAVPGDMLYQVKRAAEALTLDLTFTDSGKAAKQLEAANERLSELDAMAARDRGDGGVDADEAQQYQSTLSDFDNSVTSASAQVTTDAVNQGGAGLRSLRSWSTARKQRLSAMSPQMPDAVANSVDKSVTLLDSIADRTDSLLRRLPCDPVAEGTDTLGAMPADTACTAENPRPTSMTHSAKPSHKKAAKHKHHRSTDSDSSATTSTNAPSEPSDTESTTGSGGGLKTSVPHLPQVTSTPKLPAPTSTPSTPRVHLPTSSLKLPLPTGGAHLPGLG